MLQASKDEAILAVKLYNEPSHARALEGFIVHMNLAWLYLFQAKWKKASKDFRIADPSHKGWFIKIDDEYRAPSLGWFVEKEYSNSSAVRANIEFFIKLRNKVEHRHTGGNEALLTVISGECHSLLLNYEEAVVAVGGQSNSLAHVLHFPVFIGGFTDKGKQALVKLSNSLPSDLRTFLAEYDNNLDEDISKDPRYCLRLTVFLEQGNRKGDLSMQFYNSADLTDEQRVVFEEAASKGFIVTKNKVVPVSNASNLKPKAVVDLVSTAIPFKFNLNHFAATWRKNTFRPPQNSSTPEVTRADFCIYDEPHRDYTYTPAYVKWLIKNCATDAGFLKTTGKRAVLK